MDSKSVGEFIERWAVSGAAERANYQLFMSELCDIIGVPHPEPSTPDTSENAYVFERAVPFHDGAGGTSTRFIDLYKRGCFVLEAKQGSDPVSGDAEPLSEEAKLLRKALKKGTALRGSRAWDEAMLRARGQADQYIRALPPGEGRPPFLIVVDVGHSLELYSEFSCTGGTYIPFPAPGSHRIFIDDLANSGIRDRLRAVWTDPSSLDPSRRSAKVTCKIADRLARLALSLEAGGHPPETVAAFLMRCLFTMFAEDVWLLPKRAFTRLLKSMTDTPEHFVPMVAELWEKMNEGGFSTSLRQAVLRFNGGLFADHTALPLDRDQLLLLIDAADCEWGDVEPAIFGTLLERALDPVERHKLGAHYTPRTYVERLVLPTVIDPLRDEWAAVQAAAVNLVGQNQMKKAADEVKAFHQRLCEVRILDPACGSGNFLYVTLEHLKRIEGEIFDTLEGLGQGQEAFDLFGHMVDPHQLLGLEVNPRAAAITELVLWIGTLQWHYRNRGNIRPRQPIIRNFHNIECRDAVLEWDSAEPLLDAEGKPVTRWDGRTTRPHPATGREIPDETARVPVMKYTNPRPATWPDADFVVGNPPFIGVARMREALGDGYAEALRSAHQDVGQSSDFVMYWWNHAAELTRQGRLRRFGLVTTNSLRQTFNRRTLERHMGGKPPLSVIFAIPDHPWIDTADGADVRIAMTVGEAGNNPGVLQTVVREVPGHGEGYEVELDEHRGTIHSDLTVGVDVTGVTRLDANEGLCSEGIKPHGMGFVVTPDEAGKLGLGRIPGLENHIRPYLNGRDLTQTARGAMIIDLFGLEAEDVRRRFPEVYQWVLERVKPERDQNNRKSYRDNWWIFGEPRRELRPALAGLPRYIATVKTSKHRLFVFLDISSSPDSKLIVFAFHDAYVLGLLSSHIHCSWALSTNARLGVGNDPTYVVSTSFGAFPFPDATEAQKSRIRELGEQLDAHRKRQQERHPDLTFTGMYNVLEKLRFADVPRPRERLASAALTVGAGVAPPASDANIEGAGEQPAPRRGSGGGAPVSLTPQEKKIHDDGLVAVLKEIHDQLDAAVFDAYGWPGNLSDEEILERLVVLNAERAAEEARGLIRWLRPDYQNPDGAVQQQDFGFETPSVQASGRTARTGKRPWPTRTSERIQAIRSLLVEAESPMSAAEVAGSFNRARRDFVEDLLATLVSLARIHRLPNGQYESTPQ